MVRLPILLALAALGATSANPFTSTKLRDTINPIVISCNPSAPSAGQTVQYTVTLSATSDGTGIYAVTSTNSFSSIPSYVDGVPGSRYITFNASLKPDASGPVTVAVSGPSATAYCNSMVAAAGR